VLRLDRGRGGLPSATLSFRTRTALLREITAQAMGRAPSRRRGKLWVSVFAPRGVACAVFVAGEANAELRAFHRLVQSATLHASLLGT
jgi:hypothetical protein